MDFEIFIHVSTNSTTSFVSMGKVIVKVVPLPLLVLTVIDPLWASTMRLHIAKPNPIP